MHEESRVKKKFGCEKCGRECKKTSELKNHGKVCGGAMASSSDRVKCVWERIRENIFPEAPKYLRGMVGTAGGGSRATCGAKGAMSGLWKRHAKR